MSCLGCVIGVVGACEVGLSGLELLVKPMIGCEGLSSEGPGSALLGFRGPGEGRVDQCE